MTSPMQREVSLRLAAGLSALEPLLRRSGFERGEAEAGKGSGGRFATADFVRADRQLHLWLRGDSLSVLYDLRGHQLDHATYMRELLGPGGTNRFPSYSDDAQAAFFALHYDLAHFCDDFLNGSGEDFMRCWNQAKRDADRTPFARLDRTQNELKDD